MRIKFSSAIALLLIMINANTCAAKFDTCDGSFQNPCSVLDTWDNQASVKHWRDALMLAEAYEGDTNGLKHLWISASGAPSALGLRTIAQNIANETVNKVKKIILLDLRQESHGYLNNNALNLTEHHNWINVGKNHQEAIAAEKDWLQYTAAQEKISNVLTAKQFKKGEYSTGVSIPTQSVQSEETVAQQAGFQYERLTVSDHMAPNDEETDRFIALVKNLQADTWIHVHCRGGDGRSTTFMAMFDMLHNADKVAFDEMIKREAAIEPFYDLFKVVHKDPALTVYYKARLKFLRNFYQYSSDYLRGYSGTWSQWVKENQLQRSIKIGATVSSG